MSKERWGDICTEDNKKLYNPQQLRYHINHNHKRSHICPRCGTGYSNSSDLRTHYRNKYLKYLRYQCKICDNKFSGRNNCKAHYLSVHHNEKKAAISSKTDEWWYEHDPVNDLKFSDPDYPSEDSVQAMIESERDNSIDTEIIQPASEAGSHKDRPGVASARVSKRKKSPTKNVFKW